MELTPLPEDKLRVDEFVFFLILQLKWTEQHLLRPGH